MAADDFTWKPSYSTNLTRQPTVREVKFGDGYIGRAPDGINNAPLTYAITINLMSDSDADAIDEWLAAKRGAVSFTWTPPRKTQRKWTCKQWQVSFDEFNGNTFTGTFVEDLNP